MRYLKFLHQILGILPFVWFLTFLTMLGVGYYKFGILPVYGVHDDPSLIDIEVLSKIHAWLYLFSFLSFFIWVLVAIVFLFSHKVLLNKIHKLTYWLFFIGLLGFVVFKIVFKQNFLWVFD